MFKSSDVSYWNTSSFKNSSLILGIGYGLRFDCLLVFLKSLRKRTQFDLGLGCTKDWDPHYGSLVYSRTPSRTKLSTPFLNIYLCNFSTGYGIKNIGFEFSLIWSILYLFSRCQVFHWTTIQNFGIIPEIHYVVLLSDVGIGFPWN